MHLSAMLTSLPTDFVSAVRQVAALGFSHVDVVAREERPEDHLEALAEAGLLVSCAAVGRDLPDDQILDHPSTASRRAALEAMKRQIADAAKLGATYVYVIPGNGSEPAHLNYFAEACSLLADHAGQRMMRLCVEHIPGRALPTVAQTLAWLDQVGHQNLFLLLDVGHCLISGEDPSRMVTQASRRLGYVHLDDNDGNKDLHWPLLSGRLTIGQLRETLAALVAAGYDGALALELHPDNPEPVSDLSQGKELLERLRGEGRSTDT